MSEAQTQMGGVQHLVLQATPFCNLDCSYCYLPDRTRFEVMATDVLEAVAVLLLGLDETTDVIEVRWHAGEPLAAGRGFYEDALALLGSRLGDRFELRHSLQTNATLIDEAWCELFRDWDVRVGVSIDGPPEIHDRRRRTRNDRGTFEMTKRGIDRLRDRGVSFDTISVVDATTLDHRDGLLDLLASIAPRSVGFNVEESEGLHLSGAFASGRFEPRYAAFLERLVDWERETAIPVREFDRVRSLVLGHGLRSANEQARPFGFINVDVEGNLSTFSPELVGLSHLQYRSFAIGKVWSSWPELRGDSNLAQQSKAIAAGVRRCEGSCDYFSVCGGGAPVNKLFENGSFDSTETAMCRCAVKFVTDAVVGDLERTVREL